MPKEIQLTQGMSAIVDDEDYELLDQYYWFAMRDKVTNYAAGYLSRKPEGHAVMAGRKRRPNGRGGMAKRIPMHRFLLNAPDDMEVDHINGNGLDNRRCNLRLATRSENLANRRLFRNNKLGHKGIHYDKATGRYAVMIRVSYGTLEEAFAGT
jgi:hypothetical protein